MQKRFSSEFNPRFSDFDLQGIMNSRCYIDLLAEARLDQMVRCYKRPMDYYAKKNQTWVFSNVSLNFLSPVYFGMKVQVETEVIKMEGPVATVEFSFKNPVKGKLFASGTATYHLIDSTSKRPIDIPEEDRETFLSRPE